MFELIVLGLILAGLAAIARAPVPKSWTENPTGTDALVHPDRLPPVPQAHLPLLELLLQAGLELFHHLAAVLLVVGEALRRCELLLFTVGLMLVDRGDGIDDPRALAGKELVDLDKLAPSMDQTA
jgi:hypothetical protein